MHGIGIQTVLYESEMYKDFKTTASQM